MYILHIETATPICSVAISDGEMLVSIEESREGLNHTAVLAPMIEKVLFSAGIAMDKLEAVTVSAGPGSYTGLRVGVATAKAIAYSRQIPMVPVSTLKALAMAARVKAEDNAWIMPMLDARRMEVYCSLYYEHMVQVWQDQALILDDPGFLPMLMATAGHVVVCGDGSLKLRGLVDGLDTVRIDDSIQCSARHLILPGLEMIRQGMHGDVFHFAPAYLKAPNITVPKKAP